MSPKNVQGTSCTMVKEWMPSPWDQGHFKDVHFHHRQEISIKNMQIGKEELKLSLFIDDLIVNMAKSQEIYPPKPLEVISEFNKVLFLFLV